ncbi:MAG: RNA polymerase factor sigma-54 [Verrucomicrobia bacterium]|nr:RNA polymerase factor sigma-54 [Verrucomicrobiota bacterium]
MSQGLYLSQKMSQTVVLSPQLQQSLALLQAPILELRAQVEAELEQNPVLEESLNGELESVSKEGKDKDELAEQIDPAEPPADVTFDPATEKETSEPVDDFQAEFEKLTQLDQEWRDHFSQTNVPNRVSQEDEERRQFRFDSLVVGQSLQEMLLEQVRDANLSAELMSLAEMIVGNIDERGWLASSIEELAAATGEQVEKFAAALKVVQSFQPPGVGARDLGDCLRLQLERVGREGTLEYKIVTGHMEALGRRRFPEIARALGQDVVDVQEAADRIGHLEPHPGRAFLPDNDQYIVPEVHVQKTGEDWVVSLNNEQVPHLRISNHYKDLMARAETTPDVREYIREKIRAGKFLIKSLNQRQQTIHNIATEIVKRQHEFMEQGRSHLKPLTMNQVAEVVGVHETTVSRAVSGKYMETPHGVFEMKHFFTSGFTAADGQAVANTSIKDMVAEIIKEEDQFAPLSDDAIVKLLGSKGITIARRTVAKYRGELNILPSNLRRVY